MALGTQVPRSLVLRLLGKCAPGFELRETTHRLHVKWNGRVYRLPKGAHGDRQRRVPRDDFLTLIEHFEIEDCAERVIKGISA